MTRTLWIDVTDLLAHLEQNDRPSGIQRVVFELSKALAGHASEKVRCVRRAGGPRDFEILSWPDLERLFSEITGDGTRRSRRESIGFLVPPPAPETTPTSRAEAVASILKTQREIGRRAADFLKQRLKQRFFQNTSACLFPSRSKSSNASLAGSCRPGDVFLVPGSPWFLDDYVETVRWIRDRHRMTFSLLIHDMFPVFNPEWCDRGVITSFARWHSRILPLTDQIFTTSTATAADVMTYLNRMQVAVARRPVRIGAGNAFGKSGVTGKTVVEGKYVLFVSTLEARKNHALLLRVWRRLLEKRGPKGTPDLIFAGRRGWLVDDMMQQLENTRWLNGKIRHIASPSDGELADLYRDCLFTVFPSFAEGWGLPVAESLLFGKPCLASSAPAIMEAGGDFVRYFDPENANDAQRVIEETLDDPEELAAWTSRIRREFRPRSWASCAAIIFQTFQQENV